MKKAETASSVETESSTVELLDNEKVDTSTAESEADADQPEKRRKANAREVRFLTERAEMIRECDGNIVKMQKASMADALKAGEHLLWAKQELKRVNVGTGFQRWIEEVCKIKYKRAYNYMRLVQGAAKNAALKDLGLTEAYIALGLVRRKAVLKDLGTAPTNGTQPQGTSDTNVDQSADVPVLRKIGNWDVVRTGDCYVFEVDASDWQSAISAALDDADNFEAVLRDGGLLLKLKE